VSGGGLCGRPGSKEGGEVVTPSGSCFTGNSRAEGKDRGEHISDRDLGEAPSSDSPADKKGTGYAGKGVTDWHVGEK